jgi:LacI family transcriptional regulator
MGELDYVPSSAARTLRSNRSGLIGLITSAISHYPTGEGPGGLPDLILVQAKQRGIATSGRTLMIADTGGEPERIAPLARTFAQHRVDGLLYVADHHREVVLPNFEGRCPVVLVNCFDRIGTPAVVPDDRECQRRLVEALITNGHRRIGFLMLPKGLVAARLRALGYRDALDAAGLPIDPALMVPGNPDGTDGDSRKLRNAIDRLLALPDRPTVLCCGNDAMAMQVYGILRTRGIRVPEEISVAGFDNHRTIAETLFPPLTTVELPYSDIGARAGALLLSLIAGEASPPEKPVVVAGPVFWRGSVIGRTDLRSSKTKGRIIS